MFLTERVPEPSYPEYGQLYDEARRTTPRFIDPSSIPAWEALIQRRGYDWCTAVLGYRFSGLATVNATAVRMLELANERNITPQLPARIAQARVEREARLQTERDARAARIAQARVEWEALVKAFPIPVSLAYNYSGPNHYETYTQGAVHILPEVELRVGRLHRTPPRDALCTTGSNKHQQLFAHRHDPTDRHPTCKNCIRTMCRIAELIAPGLLAGG